MSNNTTTNRKQYYTAAELIGKLKAENIDLKKMQTIIINAHHCDLKKLTEQRNQAIEDVKKFREWSKNTGCIECWDEESKPEGLKILLQSTNHYND